ncbi:TetR/AcrR family transcriptional regulator [Deinococcus sonorensis]|uniref:TetR/AcrR family transcriptional regulator n=2 Tax=Deinococcus sonorensis TaxID=309891 RepID=A0AAU7U6S3_9DEIO
MTPASAAQRKPRTDVIRNRASILETAQHHFQQHGVGTSLEAVARDAGVGPGTLYRHFPTREALLTAVLQARSATLISRRETLRQLAAPDEALRQWLGALEDYLNAYNGLPEPLMAATRASEPDNPLTYPCDQLISMTDEFLQAAQRQGSVRPEVSARDLFQATAAVAWIRGPGPADQPSLAGLRDLLAHGYYCRPPAALQ